MAVFVANAHGNDYDPDDHDGYDSWNSLTNKTAKRCRHCDKNEKEIEGKLQGGHVEFCKMDKDKKWRRDKEKGIFITPLCPECNNPNNNELFSVDESDLVEIP